MAGADRPVGVDLFCGVGGMSLGFEQAGFEVAAAIDNDPIHLATYAANFPDTKTLYADLGRYLAESYVRPQGWATGGSMCCLVAAHAKVSRTWESTTATTHGITSF